MKSVFHDINRDLGRFYFEPKLHITHLFNKILFLLKERVATAGCDIEYHKWLHCAHSNKVEQNINRIGDVSRANKVPVLFIIHPVFETNGLFSKYKLKNLHDELADQSTTAGLITIDLLDAYKNYSAEELHQEGYAQSVEVWEGKVLVGGLYGIRIDAIFFGESMFSQVSNASKYGFIVWVNKLEKEGVKLIDCQQETDHLASLGARNIKRIEFNQILRDQIK